ncbi:diguanylate cyclase domain-containing protein [Pseudorhizobium xiangyangii]|uniref:diguanylate cyclase domain-containing protein n=1 Tax=Pseudorhizobium xiangyangii TaxID=2883104 RepID=UPI0036F2EDBE
MKGIAVGVDESERLDAVRGLGPIGMAPTPGLDTLAQLAQKFFRAPYAAVNIIDEEWQRTASESGMALTECSRENSICTHVVQKQDVLIVPDLRADFRFLKHERTLGLPQFRFYAGAPLELDPGIIVGAFCILDTEPRDFPSEQVDDLRGFASIASGLLRLHRSKVIMSLAEKELRRAAMTDPLTGFYNRSALASHVDTALQASLAAGERFGALYLDMDGFKSINDRLGHSAGDEVLRLASERIKSVVRSRDIVVRMGGDEFAIFAPNIRSRQSLADLAERLLAAFRTPFKIGDDHIRAQLSVGAAFVPDNANDRVDLVRVADGAMYRAKAGGRDCLRFAR